MSRFAVAVLIAGAALVAIGGPAAADPAGPTDYRSEIVSVEPAVEGLELRFIGGDSFLELTNLTGAEVVVVGYRGEPYMRFGADGTVEENRRSPSIYLNEDRFGDRELPPAADPDAAPEWRRVASDGRYAWHDHRTHWMNPARPPGAEPGDTILEAVVPLTVDGRAVGVTVISTLLSGPSIVPPVLGAVTALALGALAVLVGGGRRGTVTTVAVTASAALVAGVWAVRSVPPETSPSLLLWALPATALAAALVALTIGGRMTPSVSAVFVALAGTELALWSWTRREALSRAIIPSDAPPGLDRAVIAAAGVVGVIAIVSGLLRTGRSVTARPPSTRPPWIHRP
ncbi:MAG: hypothetical protein RIE08_02680 [Acidimicrobiales bacterium]